MADNEPKQVVVTEQDGAIDSILTYLKERIESPFLMSFLFSWSVINRDFLFYLFMSNDSNKHYQLASWDFSGFIWFYGYSSWASSFCYPLLSGVLMALLFSPISMTLSGCRYYFLSKVASFTQSNKSSFDLAHDIKKAEKYLEKILQETSSHSRTLSKLKSEIEHVTKSMNDQNNLLLLKKRGTITPFLINAAKFDSQYKQGYFSKIAGVNSNTLEANSIIEAEIDFMGDPRTNPHDNIKSKSTFSGSVFEFLTDENYFTLTNENSIDAMQTIIERLDSDTNVTCNLSDNLRVGISLIRCTVFKK